MPFTRLILKVLSPGMEIAARCLLGDRRDSGLHKIDMATMMEAGVTKPVGGLPPKEDPRLVHMDEVIRFEDDDEE